MNAQQRGTILTLLKTDEINKTYQTRYWFSYKDYLDPEDSFTDFAYANIDGKQQYIDLIENVFRIDDTARVYVEVYGYEEIDGKPLIYAETLIIMSRLPLDDIKRIFNEPDDIFPSDIGEDTNLSRPFFSETMGKRFLIDSHGGLISGVNLIREDEFVYYCWWD